jgi:hypothetical protein
MARNKYSTTIVENERTLSALHTLLSVKVKIMMSFSKPLRRMEGVGL